MQEDTGSVLLREDATCPGITATRNLRPRACVLQQEKTAWWEARAPQLESRPAYRTKESPHAAARTRTAHDKQSKFIKIKKNPSVFSLFIPSSLKPLAITDFFIVSIVLPFPERHVVEIIQPFQVSFFGLMCIEIPLVFHGLRARVFLVPATTRQVWIKMLSVYSKGFSADVSCKFIPW